MNDHTQSKTSDNKQSKLDQILSKLDNIERGLFKLIEDKLLAFKTELGQQVEQQFEGLKNYLEGRVTGVKNDLGETLDNHESRIVVLEKESGIRPIGDTPEDRLISSRRKRLIRNMLFIGVGVVIFNAIVLIAMIVYYKG